MAFLDRPKMNQAFLGSLLAVTLLAPGCGEVSVTTTVPLETDTFISSADASNHSELDALRISRSATLEERTIVKLPTTKKTSGDTANEILVDEMVELFFFPLWFLADLLSCDEQLFQPSNLTKAELVFDVADDQEGALAGKLELDLLSKPWFQTVSWTQAHPFSRRGIWETPGGDMDPSFTGVASAVSASTLRFDITAYLKNLNDLGGKGTHFGFLIRATGGAMNPVTLRSVQTASVSSRPRLVSTYTGVCIQSGPTLSRTTTYLGDRPVILRELP
jgi:hypothetical protein